VKTSRGLLAEQKPHEVLIATLDGGSREPIREVGETHWQPYKVGIKTLAEFKRFAAEEIPSWRNPCPLVGRSVRFAAPVGLDMERCRRLMRESGQC
jgi:hypothetical protein